MTKTEEYISKYSDYAVEQMRKYGIPASITLAQGLLESGRGTSRLAETSNNHFGVKASDSWIRSGGAYVIAQDDRPDDRFCKYESVADSYEHHSRILADSARYEKCFALPKDDYVGWCRELQAGGYASDPEYAGKIQKIIESNGLDEIDKAVLLDIPQSQTQAAVRKISFPFTGNDDIIVRNAFGKDSNGQTHNSLELLTAGRDILVSENEARIVSVSPTSNGKSSVTMEYGTAGQEMRITYSGVEKVDVREGEVRSAGDKIGSCSDSIRMTVSVRTSSGQWRDIDPVNYLSEINASATDQKKLYYNGTDLMARASVADISQNAVLSNEDWIRKLLSSDDCGLNLGSEDGLIGTLVSLYLSMMAIAEQLDQQKNVKQKITESVLQHRIDLTPVMPGLKSGEITISAEGKPVLNLDDGKTVISRALSPEEQSRISIILSNSGLSEDGKRQALSGYLNSMLIQQNLSSRFDQAMQAQQSVGESIKM